MPLSNVLRTKWKIFSSFCARNRIVQGSSPQRAALNGYGDFKNTMPRGMRPEPFLPLPRPASASKQFQEESNARLPVPDAKPGSMWPVDSCGMPQLRNTAFPAPTQSRASGKNDGGAGFWVEGDGRQPSGFKRVMPALMHFFSVFHRPQGAAAGGCEPDPAPLIHLFLLRRQFRSAYPHLLLT